MSVVFRVGDPKVVGQKGNGISELANPLDRHKQLLGSDLFSDATCLIGPDKQTAVRIPVHTFLLSCVSEPFAAMFSPGWKKEDAIHIDDVDASAIFSLLRFIYVGELVYEKGKLGHVLRVAQKYLVLSLMNFVADNMDKSDPNCVWTVLSFSLEYDVAELQDKCTKMITNNPVVYFNSADFLTASAQAIHRIISLDALNFDEVIMFYVCLNWSASECKRRELDVNPKNQRLVMEEFIYQIAFPGMDGGQFVCGPFLSGILTESDLMRIMGREKTPFRKVARRYRSPVVKRSLVGRPLGFMRSVRAWR